MFHVTRRRRLLVLLALGAVLGLLVSAAQARTVRRSSAMASPQTVRITVDSFTLGSQAWVAQDRGYFQKFGINPQIQVYSTGADGLDALLTGQADMGFALDFASLTRMVTDQLRIVGANMEPLPGFHQLAVKAGIQGPSDLIGKTMAIAPGTSQQYMTIRYLQVNHVPLSKVKIVQLSSVFDIVSALRSGSIDAAFVWGIGVQQAKSIPGVSILASDAAAHAHSVGYVVVRKDFLAKHFDAVVNVLKSVALSTSWIRNNMSAAAQIISSHANAPVDTVLASLKTQNFQLRLTSSELDSLRSVAGFAYGAGITKTQVAVKKIVDYRALKVVNPRSVQLSKFWLKK